MFFNRSLQYLETDKVRQFAQSKYVEGLNDGFLAYERNHYESEKLDPYGLNIHILEKKMNSYISPLFPPYSNQGIPPVYLYQSVEPVKQNQGQY